MPPPADALPFETVCDGTAPGAKGVPWASLPPESRLITVKLAKSLMPPPCPEPKLVIPSPPAEPMAELSLRVQPVTVIVAPTLEELLIAPPPALAPAMTPWAWLPVNVLLLIVDVLVLLKKRRWHPLV